MDIYEIKQRAEALSAQTDLMSILPTDVGDLINDLATVVNENNINGAQLGIKQTYESVAAMNEATSPVDYDGNPLKKGNLVIIYNESNVTDNNKIYTYLNPGWAFVTLLKNFENTELFYEIPGDITALNEGEGEDVVNKVKEVFGTIDGWFFVNQIDKDFLIDKNGITMSYRASSVGAGNYMFYISYYAQGIVNLELFARQIYTSGPPTLNIERVSINKSSSVSSIENGDIVLPDKSTMTLESYKASGRTDAIGVVFDKHKGLFVKKDYYSGTLIANQSVALEIFYAKVKCHAPYDGHTTQKLNLLYSTNPSTEFPVFNYAEQNGLYVASNGEIEQIIDVYDSLQAIKSNIVSFAYIASCTQRPQASFSASVFYGGAWGASDYRNPSTALNYLLIDIL